MIYNSTDLVKMQVDASPFIFRELIHTGDMVLIHGAPGVGKTRLAIGISLEIADLGIKVVYNDSESPLSLIVARLQEIGSHENLSFIVDDNCNLDFLTALARRHERIVVVIDNFSSNFVGTDQIDQVAVASIMRPISDLVKLNDGMMTVIIVHHDNRSGAMYGSSEFQRSPSLILHVEEGVVTVDKSRQEKPRTGQCFTWSISPTLWLTESEREDKFEYPYEDYPDVPKATVRQWVLRGKIPKRKKNFML